MVLPSLIAAVLNQRHRENPPTITPAEPTPPLAVTAVRGNTEATVSWRGPRTSNGSPITGYTVTSDPGAIEEVVGAEARSVVVPGLTNGTPYTFTVIATNAIGDSASASPSNSVTPATVPEAPTNVVATPGDEEVVVTWDAPASDGGEVVTGYEVTASPGGATAQVDGVTLEATVTGLENDTAYTFTVVAINDVGDSDPSDPSDPATPTAP